MRFRKLSIRLTTTDGPYEAELNFADGLVVVWGDNSMGKSTCLKSMLVALGMEAMLTTSRTELPLPPAMTTRLESPTGFHDVHTSEVYLEIENEKNDRIVVQRTIKGERKPNLVTVHFGPVLTAPGIAARSQDYFVSQGGSATREAGFHTFLAEFLGWELPTAQTYDGDESRLYLQCIFPYFVVEQTRGWSTIQPPIPNQFRIRDAHRRSIEFLLAFDAHDIALRRQELKLEKSRLESKWEQLTEQVRTLAETANASVQALPSDPQPTWPPKVNPQLIVSADKKWVHFAENIAAKKSRLEKLVGEEIPRIEEKSSVASDQLADAERNVREYQALLGRFMDALESEQDEVHRLEQRLSLIEEDIQRNKDIRVLRGLGSRSNSQVDRGHCPVCQQAINDSLMPLTEGQTVMTLDENIGFLEEQRTTFSLVLQNARRIADSRLTQSQSTNNRLLESRQKVRDLRHEFLSDARTPSVAAIRERVELESQITRESDVLRIFEKLMSQFAELSAELNRIVNELKELPKDDATENDRAKIKGWTESVRSQLAQYGFGSFPVAQVLISDTTYRPEHYGFELESLPRREQLDNDASFALQTTISASDLIRTIWAYLQGMLEISRTMKTHHPGCVVFDEPRQQSAKDVSFAELLRRASGSLSANQQVIFFTSEDLSRLKARLANLPHTLQRIEGRVLRRRT